MFFVHIGFPDRLSAFFRHQPKKKKEKGRHKLLWRKPGIHDIS